MTRPNSISVAVRDAKSSVTRFLASGQDADLVRAGELLLGALKRGRKILVCGNGGSCCDAMHFAEELTGRFRRDRPALAAIALADVAHITCVANDFGYEQIFSRQIEALGKRGDVLIGISTSGNSPNVVAAAAEARQRGLHVIGLLGKGGKMLPRCDVSILVNDSSSDRIQEVHMVVLHAWVEYIERKLWPKLYQNELRQRNTSGSVAVKKRLSMRNQG